MDENSKVEHFCRKQSWKACFKCDICEIVRRISDSNSETLKGFRACHELSLQTKIQQTRFTLSPLDLSHQFIAPRAVCVDFKPASRKNLQALFREDINWFWTTDTFDSVSVWVATCYISWRVGSARKFLMSRWEERRSKSEDFKSWLFAVSAFLSREKSFR